MRHALALVLFAFLPVSPLAADDNGAAGSLKVENEKGKESALSAEAFAKFGVAGSPAAPVLISDAVAAIDSATCGVEVSIDA